MKKITTLLVSTLISLVIYGQNIHTITSESWTSGNWQNAGKQINTYDGNGNLTNSLTQLWDSPTSAYRNYIQTNYTNNSNGTIQQDISQTWKATTSTWENSSRATYTYNGNNNPLTTTSESWISGNWQNSGKHTNTYDANGYLTNSLYKAWDSPTSSYRNYIQTNYTNNSNGTIQQYIFQMWDATLNTWKNNSRYTYIYNSNNNPLTITSESWISGNWQNAGKQTNTYDGNGYLTKNSTQLWDSSTNSYKSYSQINYTNNSNGTIQQYILQNWDATLNIWGNSSRSTYTYINTISVSANPSIGGSVSGGGNYNDGVTVTVNANANSGYAFVEWTENGNQVSINSSYSFTANANKDFVANFETTIGINNISQAYNEINIYPNPTNSQIIFSGNTNVQLTNITGCIIAIKKNINKLDLNEYPAGIYFIILTDDKGQVLQRNKIVKK